MIVSEYYTLSYDPTTKIVTFDETLHDDLNGNYISPFGRYADIRIKVLKDHVKVYVDGILRDDLCGVKISGLKINNVTCRYLHLIAPSLSILSLSNVKGQEFNLRCHISKKLMMNRVEFDYITTKHHHFLICRNIVLLHTTLHHMKLRIINNGLTVKSGTVHNIHDWSNNTLRDEFIIDDDLTDCIKNYFISELI